jgi:hypothetical protein
MSFAGAALLPLNCSITGMPAGSTNSPIFVGSIAAGTPLMIVGRNDAAACRSTRPLPSITARPSPDEKERFATLAARAGIPESALALIAIRDVLNPDAGQSAEL